jgi:hypothetical protein
MVRALGHIRLMFPCARTTYDYEKAPPAFSQQPLTLLWGAFFILAMAFITTSLRIFNKLTEIYFMVKCR